MSDGFFVAEFPADVGPGETVRLTGAEAHHAAVVRRIRLGEVVTVTDGQGRGVAGPVVAVERRLDQPSDPPGVTVVQALPKKDRADLAIDLMTEVGADRIVPWHAERCITRWSPDKAEAGQAKWATVARETSKQARRLRFPTIDPLATTDQVAALVCQAPLALVMHERATDRLAAAILPPVDEILIVIGPEGGLSQAEVDRFQSAGAQTFSLGPTVLRTSTAGAVAIAQLRTVWLAARAQADR